VHGNLSAAADGFTQAVECGRRAAAQARSLLDATRRVGWMIGMAYRLGLGRSAVIASVLSMLRQRG
jgi:hypothetical protein